MSENQSILAKAAQALGATLDAQIRKAQSSIEQPKKIDDSEFEVLFGKSVNEDPSYAIHSAGWKDKPHRLQTGHLKQMAKTDSVIAAIIQTRQNQVSNHSRYTEDVSKKGWTLKYKNEDDLLEEIRNDLKAKATKEGEAKANGENPDNAGGNEVGQDGKTDQDDNDTVNWEIERKAKAELKKRFQKRKKETREFLEQCGVLAKGNQKPFADRHWTFDSALRTWVRDSLTYDMYTSEFIYNRDESIAYFKPVDASTIKFSSNRFADYHAQAKNFDNLNLLYPEKEAAEIASQKVLELDEEALANNDYKWVQVVAGRIERAFTDAEMKVGMRNPTTDIYSNGYSIAELEIVVSLVTGHLNAEFYNQAYFTQGFSAKGILHIKSAINRRKLESVRQEWRHMLSGAKNSFRTPIFAGVDEVKWLPLTPNHQDIGFEGWMRYLIKMICAIYQIDPSEIGIAFKDEGGGSGAGITGDNTREKMEHSKDKGLYPLLRHLEDYINSNVVALLDEDFVFAFTGITSETEAEALERQNKEVKFKKTVNEIRAEDGLPPIPGMDNIILDPTFMQWYAQFSDEAKAAQAAMGGDMGAPEGAEGVEGELDPNLYDTGDQGADEGTDVAAEAQDSGLYKSLKIEYYTMGE